MPAIASQPSTAGSSIPAIMATWATIRNAPTKVAWTFRRVRASRQGLSQ